MHLGEDHGAWCLQRWFSYRCDTRKIELQRTRETDQSNIAFASQQGRTLNFHKLADSARHCGAPRHGEQTCVRTSTVSLTPLIMACCARARCVPLVLGTRVRKQSRSDANYAKHGRSHLNVNHTDAQQPVRNSDCAIPQRTCGHGPHPSTLLK